MLVVILTLLGLGTVAVYSASAIVAQNTYGQGLYFLQHHVIAVSVGLAAACACLMVPFPIIRASAKWMLLTSFVLLVLVIFIGHEAGGARRWLSLGRWSLQPSELAQLALVVYLSDLLARKGSQILDFRKGVLPVIMVTGVMAALVLVQPDLGTAVVMGSVALLLLMVARARWVHLGRILAAAGIGLVLLIVAAPYRLQRLVAFMDPWADPRGSGYQIIQSYYAFANGGVIGTGLGGSMQKLFYLPSAHTDFIFAIIGEELGLLGTTAIILLFALLLACGLRLAILTGDLFCKFLVCGIVGLLGLEALVNMAVVTGMLPTKGLPLPLVSYGGTSMIMNLVACALIFQASRYGENAVSERAVNS